MHADAGLPTQAWGPPTTRHESHAGRMTSPAGPTRRGIWAAMKADLKSEIAAVQALRLEAPFASTGDAPAVPLPTGRMSRSMQQIALTGLYDANRYASDSDARQAVITAAAASGMSLTDVERRMLQGTWPGLASFYARYSAQHRIAALKRDWTKAVDYLRKNTGSVKGDSDNVRKTPTSQPNSQPPAVPGNSDLVRSSS
jgi:hypothetical protein